MQGSSSWWDAYYSGGLDEAPSGVVVPRHAPVLHTLQGVSANFREPLDGSTGLRRTNLIFGAAYVPPTQLRAVQPHCCITRRIMVQVIEREQERIKRLEGE